MMPFDDLLGSLAKPPVGRSRRISSNEQPNWNNGNFDMTPLAPGQVLELPVLEGPGAITHIWMTSHAGGMSELNALSLRVFWDGASEPAVEAPLGDFFAVGQTPAVVDSFPVQVSPSGSLSCYWRMPFARSARIVVTNDNPNRWTGLYWQVDWIQLEELPADTPRFHARYRQEYPAVMGRDYRIADIQGRGTYVGTVLSVTMAQDGWFGEGDDYFFIDGEEVPSLQGTGSEDYFNDAWGFRPRSTAWFGQPRWLGYQAGDSGIAYRWHVLDPVTFRTSLKVAIEHTGNRPRPEEAWYIERPDFLSSVAFWYQHAGSSPAAVSAAKFEPLPGYLERRVPWKEHHLVSAFRQAKANAARVVVGTEGLFGGRPALGLQDVRDGAGVTLPFDVESEGRYAVRLLAFSMPTFGIYDIEIDDAGVAAAVDFQSPDSNESEAAEVDLLLGTHRLRAGRHVLKLRARARPDRPAGPAAVELLRLLALPAEVDRHPKTNNEAHSVRLGIGRALYAYRLAYGELPRTLAEMVDSGIMDARYLRDENGNPFAESREGGWFIVRSTAPGGWTHRWQGLDARR